MLYGSETRPFQADVGLKFVRADMQMIRRMCGVSMKDRKTSDELKKLVVGVESLHDFFFLAEPIILQINIDSIRNKIEELKTSYTTRNQISSSQYNKQI